MGFMNCATCKYWKFFVANQQWGECLKIPYCEDEEPMNPAIAVVSYSYCAAEKSDEPPLEHKLMLDTSRDFGCVLWEGK